MKTLKIVSSILLVIPTLFFLYIGWIGIIYHSPLYILVPIALIGINISQYKHNRVLLISSTFVLLAIIILICLYVGIYDALIKGVLLTYFAYDNIFKFGLISLVGLLFSLMTMIILISKKQLPTHV